MSKKPASVFERISKLLPARDRGHKLQRHMDLAYQFALVAPLGGGAMVACRLCISRKATKVRCTSPARPVP